MKISKTLFFASIVALTYTGCSHKTSGKITSDNPSTDKIQGISGVYEGLLPCADCPGIETTLTINPDNSFEISQVYIDRDSVPFISSGKITKGDKDNIWVFKNRYNETFYQFEDSALIMLNKDQERIQGLLEEHYILKKKEDYLKNDLMVTLTGKKWILTKIEGLDSLPEMEARYPHIIFDAEEQRIHGFAGCNSFFGQYQIQPDHKISFENIASTKMYCAHTMELESAFLIALSNCKELSVTGHTLQFQNAGGQTIAVFEDLDL
ncbi:copper resistance protein NlpE N-terminal domain-containing protein [Marinilabilia salmonicolor]|jgi:heat shock protein HslJ|uniref:Heat shock protein HslJ n=1 Tax=Marinilabilia salmonicolor TaxID=989 RepID=A0A2T0XMG3_9BACT|nr:META domain-containing protein [Marinilabilia salmonicolor]PRZ00125.1 heat shock protein HslJ [Marinilabilia salmonicolor]RCW38751.1 heat shock protein HslJ [Marinilabilia salmonicolor]